uniref:Uncharacterized protein n=1 Tax=Theileria annulata TaxID=5874 RepID=A0A3B0MT24_THEAN
MNYKSLAPKRLIKKFCCWHFTRKAHDSLQSSECSDLLRITTGRFLSRPERQPGKFKSSPLYHTYLISALKSGAYTISQIYT